MKVIPRHQSSAGQRFRREAEAAARLQHPNIVAPFTFGDSDAAIYYSMPYVAGPSLREVIQWARESRRPVGGVWSQILGGRDESSTETTRGLDDLGPRESAVRLLAARFAGLAETLHRAHAAGIVHRDVKPANILVHPDGQLLLTDFGLALVTDSSRITSPGEVLGTLHFMSPEQLLSNLLKIDSRTERLLARGDAVRDARWAADRSKTATSPTSSATSRARCRKSRRDSSVGCRKTSTRSCCTRSRRTPMTATRRATRSRRTCAGSSTMSRSARSRCGCRRARALFLRRRRQAIRFGVVAVAVVLLGVAILSFRSQRERSARNAAAHELCNDAAGQLDQARRDLAWSQRQFDRGERDQALERTRAGLAALERCAELVRRAQVESTAAAGLSERVVRFQVEVELERSVAEALLGDLESARKHFDEAVRIAAGDAELDALTARGRRPLLARVHGLRGAAVGDPRAHAGRCRALRVGRSEGTRRTRGRLRRSSSCPIAYTCRPKVNGR